MAEDVGQAARSDIGRRRAAAVQGGRENYHDRRAEIVAAAVELFRAQGYRSTSLSDIAEAIGTERASLYYYFSSKEEILGEAVTPIVLQNTAFVEQLLDSPGPAPQKLRRLIVHLLGSYAEHYPLLFLYLEENLSRVAKSQEAWAADMRAVNRRFETALEEIVRRGLDDGSLRALAEPRVLANGLMGAVSWTHRWYNPLHATTDAAALGEAYAELLLGGLATAPAEAAATGRAGEPAWRAAAHPDVARVTARFEAAGVPPYHVLSVRQAREVMHGVTRLQGPEVPVARIGDLLVPGAAGQLPARVYHPAPGRRLPLVIYLHGGGWTLGGFRELDRPCRRLAVAAECVVVAVDYRLAPETKFPGALEDCLAAVRWLAAEPDAVEADGENVVLMGDSAGGNLAAATTLGLRDEGGPRLAAQILLYPCLSPARTSRFSSYDTYANGPLMSRREMEWFWGHYLRGEADERDPRAVPLLAGDLTGLPPAFIVVAELDPLRDEGLAYAQRLEAAGVPTETVVYPGAAHGFWWMDGEMRQAAELDLQLARFLSARCATGDGE